MVSLESPSDKLCMPCPEERRLVMTEAPDDWIQQYQTRRVFLGGYDIQKIQHGVFRITLHPGPPASRITLRPAAVGRSDPRSGRYLRRYGLPHVDLETGLQREEEPADFCRQILSCVKEDGEV
ncbi:hypothetical protein Bbelb_262610 [Branchiostoma belcheri]|nr:hypothetical protein Bbelb_262610 [Branchiostoma belcheri]